MEWLDFLTRAIINPIDYLPLLRKTEIAFIEHIDEGSGSHSFIFNAPKSLTWKAGQHGIFTIPKQNVIGKKWRAFSIASCSDEGVIRIGTTMPAEPSDFKKKLLALQAGDTITMRGPFGELHTSARTKQIVAVAGGIGITPFRALTYQIANHRKDIALVLIYAGKNDYFTYKNEIDILAQIENITVYFVNTPDEVNQQLENAMTSYGNQAEYYLSGSPGMISALKNKLKAGSIKRILNDPFNGY